MDTPDLLVIIDDHIQTKAIKPYIKVWNYQTWSFLVIWSLRIHEHHVRLRAILFQHWWIFRRYRILSDSLIMHKTTYMRNNCVHFLKAAWSGCEFHQHNELLEEIQISVMVNYSCIRRWWWWWWWIVFVVWLTDGRRLALFLAGTIVRDTHHRESPTRREQVLSLRRTWVQA